MVFFFLSLLGILIGGAIGTAVNSTFLIGALIGWGISFILWLIFKLMKGGGILGDIADAGLDFFD